MRLICIALVATGCAGIHLRLAPGEPVNELAQACPQARTDASCTLLRRGDWAHFADLKQAVAGLPVGDRAFHYFFRHRFVSLVVRDSSDPAAAVRRYFPSYPVEYFPLAHAHVAFQGTSTCGAEPEIVLIFPGVVRTANRNEFSTQIRALEEQFPGVIVKVVDSDSFQEPSAIATIARSTVAAIDQQSGGEARIHLVGYSQGALSALWFLATTPAVARRVRTVFVMNSAAHGSEIANLLLEALEFFGLERADCSSLPKWASSPCREAAGRKLSGSLQRFLERAARMLGLSLQIPAASTLGGFLKARIEGFRSLTTHATREFWARYGAALPRTASYFSFRSVVSSDDNLPASNGLFFQFLKSVDVRRPENDMQVRLVNQSLGGPLSDVEIVGPVAEGNHWQWQLGPDDLPDAVMPRAMASRMPRTALFRAYFETLNEAGLFCTIPSATIRRSAQQ
jgi:pimeloyl-ACP methyl ester carboxylesterase